MVFVAESVNRSKALAAMINCQPLSRLSQRLLLIIRQTFDQQIELVNPSAF